MLACCFPLPWATRKPLASLQERTQPSTRTPDAKTKLRNSLPEVCKGWSTHDEYDYTQSTQHNHTICDPDAQQSAATGQFAEIRSRIDTKYHGIYTAERQELQDSLVAHTLDDGGLSHHQPWLILTAGPMGAGKSHVVGWMQENEYFLEDQVVHCDPDVFKAALPEWSEYVARDRLSAGTLCHRESGMLVEIAMEASLARGMHCWVDGSLKDGEWYRHVILDVQARFPKYAVAILEVTASADEIFERVRKRAIETGRDVPREEVLDSIERVPASVAKLIDLVSFSAIIDNSAVTPVLKKYCNADVCKISRAAREEGWDEIRRRFGRASAKSAWARSAREQDRFEMDVV
jgi:predicted ABC-type ATPase